MKVNTGGYLGPEEVIGRDDFIFNIWRILDKQSIVLTSERRIGKSSVINKIKEEGKDNWLVIKRDVEGISTTEEFVTRLIDDLCEHQSSLTQGMHWLGKLRNELNDVKILGVTIAKRAEKNWTQTLESILKQLAEAQSKSGVRVLLIWDEFPWMLQKIIRTESPVAAANLLDNLRQCRQSQQSIRMILTGSIGLHHVIKALKKDGLTNESLNDTQVLNLPSLDKENAKVLAKKLIDGENLECGDKSIISKLTNAVDYVPYYIHHVINSHKQQNIPITELSIKNIVSEAFTSANDPWHLVHYHSRLNDYYQDNAPIYEIILDEFAFSEITLSRQTLQNRLSASLRLTADNTLLAKVNDPEFIRQALQLLSADHYLQKNSKTAEFEFAFPLIKAWWSIYRV